MELTEEERHILYKALLCARDRGAGEFMPNREDLEDFALMEKKLGPKIVKKEGWINFCAVETEYRNAQTLGTYKTKELADKHATSNRIACIRIEWEEEV